MLCAKLKAALIARAGQAGSKHTYRRQEVGQVLEHPTGLHHDMFAHDCRVGGAPHSMPPPPSVIIVSPQGIDHWTGAQEHKIGSSDGERKGRFVCAPHPAWSLRGCCHPPPALSYPHTQAGRLPTGWGGWMASCLASSRAGVTCQGLTGPGSTSGPPAHSSKAASLSQ